MIISVKWRRPIHKHANLYGPDPFQKLGSTTLPPSLSPNLANSRLLLSPLPYPPFSSPRRDVSSWLEGCMSWPETRLRRLCRRRRFRSRIVIHLLLEIVNNRAKWKAQGHRGNVSVGCWTENEHEAGSNFFSPSYFLFLFDFWFAFREYCRELLDFCVTENVYLEKKLKFWLFQFCNRIIFPF